MRLEDAKKQYRALCLALHADKVPKHLAKESAAAVHEVKSAWEKIQQQGSRVALGPPGEVSDLRYERTTPPGMDDWTVVVSWKPPALDTQRPVTEYVVYARSGLHVVDQGVVPPQTGEFGRVEFAVSSTRAHNLPFKHRRQFEVVVQAKNNAGLAQQRVIVVSPRA
jgi:hypothetical protein